MARRQFTIFAAPGYRSEAEDLAVRIRMHNPHSIPLVRVVGTFERLHAELKKEDRTDWLFLFADWVDGKLDYGGQRRSLAGWRHSGMEPSGSMTWRSCGSRARSPVASPPPGSGSCAS